MPYLTETEHKKLMLDLIKAEQINAELLEALKNIIEIGKRDLSNTKYDSYFNSAQKAIAKAESN